jgi:hypothetical protein
VFLLIFRTGNTGGGPPTTMKISPLAKKEIPFGYAQDMLRSLRSFRMTRKKLIFKAGSPCIIEYALNASGATFLLCKYDLDHIPGPGTMVNYERHLFECCYIHRCTSFLCVCGEKSRGSAASGFLCFGLDTGARQVVSVEPSGLKDGLRRSPLVKIVGDG